MDRGLTPPVEQAALMMFRTGFAILVILMPVAMLVSRRAPLILAPIGLIVILIASLLLAVENTMPSWRSIRPRGPISIAIVFLLLWSMLSLLWTPYVSAGAERLFRMASCAGLVAIVLLLMPMRMRSSNLYLIAIGASIGTAALIVAFVAKPKFITRDTFERALILTCLLAWPATSWLAIKQRSSSAMVLAAAVGGLSLAWQGGAILPALLAGAVVLGGAYSNRHSTGAALTAAVGVMVLGAPLLALMIGLLPTQSSGIGITGLGSTLQSWADVIQRDPLRLLTGHGIDTALRNRLSSILDPTAPKSLLFEIWYELGLFGALALAVTLISILRMIVRLDAALAPFMLGCFAFTFTLAATGLGTSQTWWLWSLAAVVVCYAALARGDIRGSSRMRLP